MDDASAFWPGNGGYGRAAFYAYAYLEPPCYGDTRLQETYEGAADKAGWDRQALERQALERSA
jgi:hypothetical protein